MVNPALAAQVFIHHRIRALYITLADYFSDDKVSYHRHVHPLSPSMCPILHSDVGPSAWNDLPFELCFMLMAGKVDGPAAGGGGVFPPRPGPLVSWWGGG